MCGLNNLEFGIHFLFATGVSIGVVFQSCCECQYLHRVEAEKETPRHTKLAKLLFDVGNISGGRQLQVRIVIPVFAHGEAGLRWPSGDVLETLDNEQYLHQASLIGARELFRFGGFVQSVCASNFRMHPRRPRWLRSILGRVKRRS